MCSTMNITRLLPSGNGKQLHFCIHIFMNGCTAYISSLTTKIYLHGIHHHENDKYHEWKPLSWLYYDDMLLFGIHVFVYSQATHRNSSAKQIRMNGPISIHPVVRMIYFLNRSFYRLFLPEIICLTIFKIVIICIRTDMELS